MLINYNILSLSFGPFFGSPNFMINFFVLSKQHIVNYMIYRIISFKIDSMSDNFI